MSSFKRIAEYVPGSDVTHHSRLDLDQVVSKLHIDNFMKSTFQRDLMSFLAKQPPDFEAAKRIYTEVSPRKRNWLTQVKADFESSRTNSYKANFDMINDSNTCENPGRSLWEDNRDQTRSETGKGL